MNSIYADGADDADDGARTMGGVTVFGDTSFLGRRVVRYLRDAGETVRIASRHDAAKGDGVERIVADVHDGRSVEAAVAGADDTLSLYIGHGNETFRSVHVEAAARVANAARRAGVKRFVHVSGIGADPTSVSPYIRSRGESKAAVDAAFPGAVHCGHSASFSSPAAACQRFWICAGIRLGYGGGRAGCVRGFATVKGRSRESRSMVVGS